MKIKMHSLSSAPQLSFFNAFGWCRLATSERCTMMWKMGSKEDATTNMESSFFVRRRNIPNDARKGSMNLPQVYLQRDHLLEHGSLNKDMPLPLINKSHEIYEFIDYIKSILSSMDDGRISVSPYDTAWVALIRDPDQGRNIPQFPSSIEWISNNQLSDGSWGDEHYFLAYDRLLNTLACVVALRYWNVHGDKSDRGISFVKDNISKLGDASPEHMTCGFEVVFPALLQRAKDLNIDGIPYDAPVIQDIFNVRDRKMKRVPKELLHEVPTCLLHNLEGLGNLESLGKLEWPKILKLQTPKGSFITSPAATCYAIMETNDQDCIDFIQYVVKKFNGGAPTVYPVDIYARLWAVDRLERLGISRFFEPEIKSCLDHVYRFWTEKGVFSARNSEFCDIDDTSMGIRLLRLHGYNITPNALKTFKNGDEFTCYVGQGFESPSPIFNLYRASQVSFPGETILEEAKQFSYNFLKQKLDKNELLDKWLISKHLPSEIKCGLEMPWYASLPRLETRFYIENYGADDIWIGKSLYRMPEINEERYLELGKLDYNRCQAQHQMEWNHMQQWYEHSNLEEFGVSKKELLLAFFVASSSIFETERYGERIVWVKTNILSNILSNHYYSIDDSSEQRTELLTELKNKQGRKWGYSYTKVHRLIAILLETLQESTTHALDRTGVDVSSLLLDLWGAWLKKLTGEGDEEIKQVELIVGTLNICGGHISSKDDKLSHDEYTTLCRLSNKICGQLAEFENGTKKVNDVERTKSEIDKDMQLLLKLVLHPNSSCNLSKDVKQTFFVVVRAFYYKAYFATEQIDSHISKVLFQQVV
ncbi:hypothetical protein ABFX02_01G036900 [Erythranthe guttata]